MGCLRLYSGRGSRLAARNVHVCSLELRAAVCVCVSCLCVFGAVCCQLEESETRPNAAQTVYATGLKRCPDCVPMWRAAARLEEAQGNVGRARALLEQVRVCSRCPMGRTVHQ